MNPLARRRFGIGIRVLFALAGLAFLVAAFRATWDRSHEQVLPSAWALALAFGLVLIGLVLGARGWASLLSADAPERTLTRGYYMAQVGKYVPGAVWQAAAQVDLARRTGVPTPVAVVAFPVHAVAQATAGGTIAAGLLVAGPGVPRGIRVASLAGLLLLPLLRRTWMLRTVRVMGRVLHRSWPDELVPAQSRILRSYGFSLGTIVCNGLAFLFLASSVHAVSSAVSCVPGFALAWTAGYLALPFPTGVGIREAVLIALFGGTGATAPLLGASVAHRLVSIVAELVLFVWGSTRGAGRLALRSGTPGPGPA
jgi:uncharacterized membrane protein YbhN (UPF0104 family)